MRLRVVLIFAIVIALVGVAGLFAALQPTTEVNNTLVPLIDSASEAAAETVVGAYKLQLGSDPFPMTVGPNTLRVSLTDESGAAIEGADINVTREVMGHVGATLAGATLVQGDDGVYVGRFVWPTASQWRIQVAARLPDGATLAETYEIYIYAIPPQKVSGEPYYHGLTATNEAVAADPDRELWIVIPQGTQDMIKHGMAADVVPEEIRLAASGRNTLIIRNNDISDHTIGPYFVRAGETVRQRFTQPATFVGTCSIRQQAEVSIIVEG
jgi:hypothetical protein